MTRKFLGERLLESGLIRERQLAEALQVQQTTGEQLGQILVRLGHLEEDSLVRLLCEDAGIPFLELAGVEPESAALDAVPEHFARTVPLLPLSVRNGSITVAFANPLDINVISAVERVAGHRVRPVGAARERIARGLEDAYGRPRSADDRAGIPQQRSAAPADAPPAPPRVEELDADASASEIVNEILRQGISRGATDIHIEPTPTSIRTRFRLDGILREGPSYGKSAQSPLVTRVKVLAGLNIAESRLPQDGRMRVGAGDREVDLRISTFPTLHGEDVVLRVLDRERVPLHLEGLGASGDDLDILRSVLARPWGLILITGPTGSGKTTTLYSALTEVNGGERCILTLEDPIEYEIEGVRQAQINPRAGLTFANGLRSMLRHDPDVILVGEIRDLDTAQIALSAAMTGHMVLSTIHTNTAASAIPRLLDMGTESFALASSLQLSVAQRLVRVLCRRCREHAEVPGAVRRRFELVDSVVYRAVGCESCSGTGYSGRKAIFEMLPTSPSVAEAIRQRRPDEEIQRLSGRPTLLQAGLSRVREGVTTLEELLRVVSI